ncbi:gamma-butyrobetaine dioxygenase-like [Paramuricea clavata]|uniref:Gamma-butyrobetaine dioxygenase-like n=1 Tax=Paramuricea clavata TaxID=317549 RepID=A0A7D9IDZ3_PARCT|nr:gamma-butyrobetaine dioxygenase-like [Paramuricea clavata]
METMNNEQPIQLLHCIHENTSGGDNIFVDGFNVAKQVYENHPDAFDVLKTFYVRFVDFGTDAYGNFTFGYSHPIINVNKHGRINSFVYSASAESDSKGDCTPDELLAFYDASYVLMKGLHDPNNVIDIHLKSGQIAMFHNDRVLHGRTAFESTAEEPMARWLQGMYFDWDVVFSKLQVLQMKLGLKTPYLPEQSDDYF